MRLNLLIKNVLIFVSLIVLIYCFYLQTRPNKDTVKSNKPQEYMTHITISNYSEQGNTKEILRAEYWEFIPEKGCSDLINPHVTVYKPNGDVWYLTAHKALAWHSTMADKVSKVELYDGVVIERAALNKAAPIKVETLAMQYTPATDMITSEEFVSMQQPGLTISGIGMRGYLDRNWIELHEKITTIYTPKAK